MLKSFVDSREVTFVSLDEVRLCEVERVSGGDMRVGGLEVVGECL